MSNYELDPLHGPNRDSINDALKRLRLGPHAPYDPVAALVTRRDLIQARVVDAVKTVFKDHSPTKDEFANFVGNLYQAEFSAWSKEEILVYLSLLHTEMMFTALFGS